MDVTNDLGVVGMQDGFGCVADWWAFVVAGVGVGEGGCEEGCEGGHRLELVARIEPFAVGVRRIWIFVREEMLSWLVRAKK